MPLFRTSLAPCARGGNDYAFLLVNGDVNTRTPIAHTLERAFEREDLAKQGSETLLQRALADIRDPRRAASPSAMQRSRIPLSSPIFGVHLQNENKWHEQHAAAARPRLVSVGELGWEQKRCE